MNMCFINSNDTLITLFTSKTKEKRICTETATIYALKYSDKRLTTINARALWISF